MITFWNKPEFLEIASKLFSLLVGYLMHLRNVLTKIERDKDAKLISQEEFDRQKAAIFTREHYLRNLNNKIGKKEEFTLDEWVYLLHFLSRPNIATIVSNIHGKKLPSATARKLLLNTTRDTIQKVLKYAEFAKSIKDLRHEISADEQDEIGDI
jgi:hypothetical protein